MEGASGDQAANLEAVKEEFGVWVPTTAVGVAGGEATDEDLSVFNALGLLNRLMQDYLSAENHYSMHMIFAYRAGLNRR